MSTSKHIDVIFLMISLLTILLTGLFINGKALGLAPVADVDASDSQFTANDLAADWDTAGATQITLADEGGSVKGNGAYIYDGNVHIVYAGKYVISGELTNGSLIVDADSKDKIWILLDGVSLHCEDSAAILIEQAGKVFLTLASGTENTISSGESYSEEAISSKIDGAIYSRDDLTINGSGSLSVAAAYQHGIVGNDDLVFAGGNIEITAAQDGVHANDSVRLTDVNLTINAGDDGITASNDDETAYIYVESGHISIPSCYEGIEAIDITIAGGVIDIRPTDDGINANGRGNNSVIRITGGDITIINESGRDADGLDSNGSIHVSGGNIFISVNTSSCALDCGSENGGVCEISGGTVVAAGGSMMAEGFDPSSEQNFIMYTTSTAAAGTTVTLKNEAGDTLISETIPCNFSSVVISTPELQFGETCTISIGDSSEEITVDNSSSSGGFGMGGMRGGGMFGGGMRGGMLGGQGNRTKRSSGDQPDGMSTEVMNLQSQNAPDASDSNSQPPDVPELPDGYARRGEMPRMPDIDFPSGELPQTPDSAPADREAPQMPDSGSMPQMPDGGFANGGNRRGGDQFMQRGQNRDWTQDSASVETSVISSDTLILVGVSVLVLLAGIFIALKTKHNG